MLHQFPDYSLINRMVSNGHLSANTGSGTAESMETISQESSPGADHSSNILPFRKPTMVTQEELRLLTLVLLGMTLGVIVIALFVDFHVSRETSSRETVQQHVSRETAKKGDSQNESDSTGAE